MANGEVYFPGNPASIPVRAVGNGDDTYSLSVSTPGADVVTGKAIVEQRYTYAHGSASGLVKAGVGFVHAVCFSAITAAVVDVYDNTSATGDKIRTLRVAAGVTVELTVNASFATGLYVNIVSGTGEWGVSYR